MAIQNSKHCAGTTMGGEACGGFAVSGSEYCFTHSPERAAEREEARLKGGFHKRTPKATEGVECPQIESAGDALNLVNLTIRDLWVMDNGVDRARALLAAAETAIKIAEIDELEERIKQLEKRSD